MRRLAIWTSVATILTLNIVIWLGVLGRGDSLLFGQMLDALHVVLPVSSILIVALLVKDRHWAAASVFAAVVTGMFVILGFRLAGIHLSGGFHLGTDLCALQAYVAVVPWYRSKLAAKTGEAGT
jgi:hypothetical protein